ncbi:MAG: phenylalanine--tRNA ligase subunit alpha, partial [Solobacterium sp.]|nr:phenylalanine--tRNA ligase subunit alpha [Solobacterium sp.]
MIEQIEQVLQEALAAISAADTPEALNAVRIQYLGKKGSIQALMTKMKDLPKEEKPAFGQKVNGLKTAVSEQLEARQAALKEAVQKTRMAAEAIDITLPGTKLEAGTTHP